VRLDGERWRTFFDAFQRTAFRLETYPSYDVTSEREEYEGFLSSGSLSIPDDDSWLTRVRRFRATGRWIGRVHIVRRPLTDYLRYEFAVYRHTVGAGEDIRILDLTSQPNPACRARTSGSSMRRGSCAWTTTTRACRSAASFSKASIRPRMPSGSV
jgi:hypothetical protein